MASGKFGHRTKFEKPCFYSLNKVFENEVCPNYPQKRPNLPELSAVAENVVRASSGNFGQSRTVEYAFLFFKSIFYIVCPCPNLPEVVFVVFGVQREKLNAPGKKNPAACYLGRIKPNTMLKIGTEVIYTGNDEEYKGKKAKIIASYAQKQLKFDITKNRNVEIPEDGMDYYLSFAFGVGINFGMSVSAADIQAVN